VTTGHLNTSKGLASANCFASQAAAQRYARVRPQYHPQAVRWICEAAGVENLGRVLDVGCGTGHSTMALAGVAQSVLGVDASSAMLALAPEAGNVRYLQCQAEAMDFAPASFDLVVAASAMHWLKPKAFLERVRKILIPGGHLAIYNDHFTATMLGNPECKLWLRTRLARRFPPLRGLRDLDEAAAAAEGFSVAARGSFNHAVTYTRQEFADFLLTRSNTLAKISDSQESASLAEQWILDELAAFLPAEGGEFLFKCNLWLLSQTATLPSKRDSSERGQSI
jgi:SAM-dependent methyltransferase